MTGDVVKESVLAPFDMVDVEATERNKAMILNEVDPVEYVDSTIQVDVKKTIEKFSKPFSKSVKHITTIQEWLKIFSRLLNETIYMA